MMFSPRWYKVLSDIWGNKTRTVLVVLSIAVGVFAVGMIATSRGVLARDMAESYAAISPSSATIYTFDPFDDDLVQTVRRMRGVKEAEGRRNTSVRIQVGPDEWRDLQLFAIDDYDDIRINRVEPESGAWPPPEHEVLIERAALGLARAEVGDVILIKTPGGKKRQLRIAGLAHDFSQMPAAFDGTVYGYITFDTLEWLGEPRDFNLLHIVVAENADDKEHVQYVAKEVQDKVEKSGRAVFWTWVPDPGKHPLEDIVQAILLVLGVLGLLSLLLSGFLVINTISALLAQQVRQIGVMKAVGFRANQIMGMYFTMVIIFGLLSLFVAVPLGAIGARLFSRFMAGFLNFDLADFGVPPQVLAIQCAVGLVVPLLAALYPVISGTRVTAREAMSDYGLGKGQFGRSFIDRLLQRVRGLSRPLLLSLRNTFRRRGRLLLTLITLTMGGAIFIGVFTVRASLLLTLDDLLQLWQYDIWVILNRPYRLAHIEHEARQVPGVVEAKGVGFATARRVRADDSESENIFMFGTPAGTDLVRPIIVQGRWLLPEDENAVIISTAVLKNEPDIEVGGEIVLKIEGREATWRVVGVSQFVAPFAYANYPYFSRVVRDVDRASSVWVVAEEHDLAFQSEVAQKLEKHFERVGLRIGSMVKIAEERAETEALFNVLVVILLVMAVLLAVVGGLGLMGTMSINVLERTREIGVMRAIGASDGSVLQIFMVEGVLIGVLSWLVGTVLALPLSKLFSDAVGIALMQMPLNYTFSASGALLWLMVVVILAALASFLPARSASRLTVREVLAYE